jgi:hypothetical protein
MSNRRAFLYLCQVAIQQLLASRVFREAAAVDAVGAGAGVGAVAGAVPADPPTPDLLAARNTAPRRRYRFPRSSTYFAPTSWSWHFLKFLSIRLHSAKIDLSRSYASFLAVRMLNRGLGRFFIAKLLLFSILHLYRWLATH